MNRKQWRKIIADTILGRVPNSHISELQLLSMQRDDPLRFSVRVRANSRAYIARLDFLMRYHGGPIPFFTDRFIYVGSNHL